MGSERMYLWNPTPIGEAVVLGNSHDRLLKVVCSERSLRLAHKHLLQYSKEKFQGFLIGTINLNEDGSEISVNLDRFDPGTISNNHENSPSIVFPNDVVVPFKMMKAESNTNGMELSNETKEHFGSALEMLQDTIDRHSIIDLNCFFAISLHCFYSDDQLVDDTSINLQFYWNAVFISSTLQMSLVKNVPIIPTALAKTLANSLDFIQEDSIKTGIMTMDKTRKLLLMLDSDPKVASVSAVGVWVSYVPNIYHPAVWLTCLRFLSNSFCKKIFSEDNEFLVVVYSVPNSRPTFYKCSADQFDQLAFDIVTAEHFLTLKNQSYQNSKMINVTLDYLPTADDQSRIMFDRALCEHQTKKPVILSKKDKPPRSSDKKILPPVSSSQPNPNPSEAPTSVSKPNPDFRPSPVPTPITQTKPILPAVLEPSLIMNESSNNSVAVVGRQFKEQVTPEIPMYSYQHELDDELVPSFYNGSPVLKTVTSVTLGNGPVSSHKQQKNFEPTSNSASEQKPSGFPAQTTRNCSKTSFASNQSNPDNHRSSLKEQSWFKSLPHDARKYYIDQEQRFQYLTEKLDRLQSDSMSYKKPDRVDIGTQVCIEDTRQYPLQSIGVNTEETIDLNNELGETKLVGETNNFSENLSNQSNVSTSTSQTPIFSPGETVEDASITSKATNKVDSEFSSIQLNSSALNTSNNEQSTVSSLKAVDLPGLDSTTENNSTPCALDLMNQNSPVLGESASMYLAAKTRRSAKDQFSSDEEDQEFFGNLLKQVKEMLGKGNDDLEIEKSTFLPSHYPLSTLKYNRSYSTPLVPHLTNIGVMAHRDVGNYDLSTLLGTSSGHDLSMHANAIAMKYLTDEQLANIAARSSDDAATKILDQTTSSASHPTTSNDKYTGLSLLSPANMSLATKKYMKKYGLVPLEEEEEDSDDEDKENVFPIEKSEENDLSVLSEQDLHLRNPKEKTNIEKLQGLKSQEDKKAMKSVTQRSDTTEGSIGQDSDNLSDNCSTPGWSNLKNNLGETFDMLLPFLSDLEKNQQAAPSDKDLVIREGLREDGNVIRDRSRDKKSGSGETVAQILSPRILKTIKRANKKLERMKKDENLTASHNDDSEQSTLSKKNITKKAYSYSQESHLSVPDVSSNPPPSCGKAKSIDLSSPRDRACSVDRILRHKRLASTGNHRRLSSSPTRAKHYSNTRKNSRKVSYERVLDSQVMLAFHKDADVESRLEPNDSDSVEESGNNILNIKRIQSLQKLA